MYLKSLSLNGFKSFALPTTLKFTSGVTAIVGPNGSGKSNVSDAARWVLGEKSLKMLRGKKGGDVIFAGSHLRAAHSMAEVTLNFDNSDDSIPFDAAEVAITRRLFRNGDSEFEINGTQVRLIDIIDLLAKSGLGERSYAVIGQGQVDAILRASIAERKEFFEEAAGVKQFQAKKEQALRKLEITRRNLIRVEDLVKELTPRLNSLKRQAERAALHDQVQAELRTKSLEWFGAELAAIDDSSKEDLEQINKIQKERETIETKISALEKSHGAAEEQATSDLREKLKEQLLAARQNLTELDAEQAETRRKLASLQEKDLPLDVSNLPNQIAETQARLDQLKRRSAELTPQTKVLKEQVANAEKQSQETAAKIQKLRGLITKQRPNRHIDQREILGIVKELDSSFNQLITAIKTVTHLEDLEKIIALTKQPKNQLQDLRNRLDHSAPVDHVKINQELDHLQESRDGLLAQLASRREQLARKETELSLLDKQIVQQEKLLKDYQHQLKAVQKTGQKGAKKAALQAYEQTIIDTEKKIKQENQIIKNVEHKITETEKAEQAIREETRASLRESQKLRQQLTTIIDQQSKLNVEKGKYDVRREDLLKEAQEYLGENAIKIISRGGAKLLTEFKRRVLKNQVDDLRKKLELAGGVDETVLQEHKETAERHTFLTSQSKDLTEASDKLRDVIKKLDQEIQRRFSRSVDQINKEFDKAFKILFEGGFARLIQVREKSQPPKQEQEEEETTPTDEITREVERLRDSDGIIGIDIKATPPGKKLQSISMLSGGEKALTSIALLSAILATKPSPFVILDEVDAALDEANSRRFSKILKTLTNKTQFITITHNRETMRQADILYGVTMQKDGVSKILSVKLEAFDEQGRVKNSD